jgi:hypothetical protein
MPAPGDIGDRQRFRIGSETGVSLRTRKPHLLIRDRLGTSGLPRCTSGTLDDFQDFPEPTLLYEDNFTLFGLIVRGNLNSVSREVNSGISDGSG